MKRRLTQSEAMERFSERGLDMVGEYLGSMLPVLVKCRACGHQYQTSINNIHKAGRGCLKCGGTMRLTQDVASARYLERGFELLGVYRNNQLPVIAKCLTCSREWNTIPIKVFAGSRCPDC